MLIAPTEKILNSHIITGLIKSKYSRATIKPMKIKREYLSME
jgi:hypothetical protein